MDKRKFIADLVFVMYDKESTLPLATRRYIDSLSEDDRDIIKVFLEHKEILVYEDDGSPQLKEIVISSPSELWEYLQKTNKE